MWSGSSASIPSNWKICDGANGTPDLRNRFIVAAGSTYGVGGTGGSNVHSLSTGQLPAHSHPGNISESGTHTHKYNDPRVGTYQGLLYDATGTAMEYPTEAGGTTTSTGSSHSHSFTTDNTGSGQSIDHTPLYYALYYIMKISN
jgi:microcystin-dependent protein